MPARTDERVQALIRQRAVRPGHAPQHERRQLAPVLPGVPRSASSTISRRWSLRLASSVVISATVQTRAAGPEATGENPAALLL